LDSQVELSDDNEQFDPATYVVALAFNDAALPPNMPEWLKAAIQARADQLRSDPDNLMLAGQVSERDAKQKRIDDANEELLSQLSQVAQQREAWASGEHRFAGVSMTGKEWEDLANDLKRDGPLRDWLIQRLMRESISKADADKKAAEFADIAAIMAKPKSEWTPAEHEKMDRASDDPTFKKVMPELQDQQRNLAAGSGLRDSRDTDRDKSVGAGNDLFASAPNLTDQYRVAVVATQPLDTQKLSTAPVVLPPAPAGLEV